MDEGAGCLGALLLIAVFGWVPLHFSGKSILYWRDETQTNGQYGINFGVKCRYFTSTGTETTYHFFGYENARSAFYCPRIKDIGQ